MTHARGPRRFDPVVLGNREADAWVAYYRREWRTFLKAAVGMVRVGFGMGPLASTLGAWHVLRANQRWAPFPDNDPDAARASMRRFYALVASRLDLDLDTARAAELEVEWWRRHRAHQHDPEVAGGDLVQGLVDLYAFVYAVPADSVREAAQSRVDAMDLSDRWVAAGRRLEDPLLAQERAALVASYTSLRRAVGD